jgi:lipopolysaccharide biosynthesis glycosyltransferase
MYAIATLVMGGNSYVPAAVALAKSIKRFSNHSDVDLVCLITDDVTDVAPLEQQYHHVYIVNKITATDIPSLGGLSATKIYHWISDAPTKWNIFALDKYEKVLFLDADMIVLQDIYELFSLDVPAGMFDHQAAREYATNPIWTGHKDKGGGFINWYKVVLGLETKKSVNINNRSSEMTTGTKIPSVCLDNLRYHSNSQFAMHGGIALIKPDMKLLEEYKKRLPDIIHSLMKKESYGRIFSHKVPPLYVKTEKTLSSIDEVTLSLFMHDMGYQWTHIGMEYNVAAYHTYSIFKKRTKILHYVGCYKPWSRGEDGSGEREYVQKMYNLNINPAYKLHHEVVELWWNMYELSQEETVVNTVDIIHPLQECI